MQTMTSTSCDTDVAELPCHRRRPAPGKILTLLRVPYASSSLGKAEPAPAFSGTFLECPSKSGRTCFALPGYQPGLRAEPQAEAVAARAARRTVTGPAGGLIGRNLPARRPPRWPGISSIAYPAASCDRLARCSRRS